MASRTVTQRSNADGFPKAGELIEMTGLEDLEAGQRAISNLLYQHAHDSGRIAEPGAEFEIPMATIRSAVSKHESGDRLRQSLLAIAGVLMTPAAQAATILLGGYPNSVQLPVTRRLRRLVDLVLERLPLCPEYGW